MLQFHNVLRDLPVSIVESLLTQLLMFLCFIPFIMLWVRCWSSNCILVYDWVNVFCVDACSKFFEACCVFRNFIAVLCCVFVAQYYCKCTFNDCVQSECHQFYCDIEVWLNFIALILDLVSPSLLQLKHLARCLEIYVLQDWWAYILHLNCARICAFRCCSWIDPMHSSFLWCPLW